MIGFKHTFNGKKHKKTGKYDWIHTLNFRYAGSCHDKNKAGKYVLLLININRVFKRINKNPCMTTRLKASILPPTALAGNHCVKNVNNGMGCTSNGKGTVGTFTKS